MIAQLRKKFVLITMGSVLLVLVVLMGVINVTNYVKMDRGADQVLEVLAENGGTFPDLGKHRGAMGAPDGDADDPGAPGGAGAQDSSAGAQTAAADAGKTDEANLIADKQYGFSAETPYETRFFSVQLNTSGSLAAVNTGKIAAVSTEEAVSMAQALWASGKTGGYSGSYKYLAQQTDSGTLYIFLDCTRDLNSFKNFLSISLLVSLCGMLAVFGLVMVLSRRAIRPVAESYEKQKRFITNAGHEIKTPLAIIDSCTEVLEMEQGENKWTQGIRGQVQRLTSLTQSLVSLARMDEGSTNLPMAEFDLSAAVQETLDPFVLLAENRQKRLLCEVQPGIRLRGNEQTLRQLCSILADNAVKYALPESEIRVSLARKGKKIVLSSDNAAEGLKPGDQSILFDRFYRGDTSHSSEKSGYGIGLSMAQSIVTAHGGKIEAKSPDGKRLLITAQI